MASSTRSTRAITASASPPTSSKQATDGAMTAQPQAGGGLTIVDAHHHFWDPERNYHPWLRDEPPIPFRYGDYGALARRYLATEYLADACNYTVAGLVYVETEGDPTDPVGEMAYVAGLRRARGAPWTVEANREIVLTTIDLFGIERCMFASNFPVDSLCATFDEIYGGFDAITCDFSEGDRRLLFADNARRLYDIR